MRVLVIGRARGVWEEVAALQALAAFDATIVVGQAAIDYPGRIDHWVSFHADLFDMWAEKRAHRGFSEPVQRWATIYRGRPQRGADAPGVRRVRCDGGSSGMVGTVVALDELGADRVALAGIPLDADRGHYDQDEAWVEAERYREAWVEAAPRLMGRVRSMSGWTMSLLGGAPPTREWLEGGE